MINLLPLQEKKVLVQEENWRLILTLGVLFLASLISLALIIFSIKIYTSSQTEMQKMAFSQKEKEFALIENQNLQEKISTLNQDLSKLKSFYQNQVDLTNLIEKISGILPPDVYLTSFSCTLSSSSEHDYLAKISLSGFSPTREALFQFKKNLENEKIFKEIYFPPSNWVDPVNIDFSLTLQVTK